jgi:hypothetical protein
MKKLILILISALLPLTVVAATLSGSQGGTGFASTTSGNVGTFLQVASTSPFLTYTFAPAGGGSISTSSQLTAGQWIVASAYNTVYSTTSIPILLQLLTASGTNIQVVTSTSGGLSIGISVNPSFSNVSTTNISASGYLQGNAFDPQGNKYTTSTIPNLVFTNASGSNITVTGYGTFPTLNFTNASGTNVTASGYLQGVSLNISGQSTLSSVSSTNLTASGYLQGTNGYITNISSTNITTTGYGTFPALNFTNASGTNITASGYIQGTTFDPSGNKYVTSTSGGSATYSLPEVFTNLTTANDTSLFIFNTTSTITRLTSVNQNSGDSITFNWIWCPSISSASSTCSHLFSANTTSTATTGPDVYTSFASTTVPINSVLRFTTPNPTNAAGAPTFIKVVSSSIFNSAQTAITASITVTNGDTLIVSCAAYLPGTIDSVTDGTNTYVEDANGTKAGAGIQKIYHASNVPAGTYTVSCNTSNMNYHALIVNEYSGLALTNLIDASSSAQSGSNSSTTDPGNVTTNSSTDLLFTTGLVADGGAGTIPAPCCGATQRAYILGSPAIHVADWDRNTAAPGTYSSWATNWEVQPWTSEVVAYRSQVITAAVVVSSSKVIQVLNYTSP